jgi:hypothetical protein
MMSIAFEQAGSTSAKPTITSRAMIRFMQCVLERRRFRLG